MQDDIFYREPDVQSFDDPVVEVYCPELDANEVRELLDSELNLASKYEPLEYTSPDHHYAFTSPSGGTQQVELYERFGQWHVRGTSWGILDGFRQWLHNRLGR